MDFDDEVMINSEAPWPLLDAQWKDPKNWWKELVTAEGRKDYDWADLSARYFPKCVGEKCKSDPSLAVAHDCFWKYHPALCDAKPVLDLDAPKSNTFAATIAKAPCAKK